MDIERAMEFIIERQAEASASIATLAAGQVETEKRLKATAKLLQAGMKMLARVEQRMDELSSAQKELAEEHKKLAAAQRATERNLNRLIESLRNGTNGRSH